MNNLKKMNYPFKDGGALTANDMNIIGDMMKDAGYLNDKGQVIGDNRITDSVNADLDLSTLLSNLPFFKFYTKDENGEEKEYYLNFKDNEVLNGFTLRVPFNYCTAEPNVLYRSCGTLKENAEENIIQLPIPLGTIFNALPQNIANVSGQLTTFNMRMFGQDITIPAIYKGDDKTFEGYSHRICFNGGLVGWGLLSGMGLPIHFSLYCKENPTKVIDTPIRTKLSIGVSGLDILLDGMPIEMILKLFYGISFADKIMGMHFENQEAYQNYIKEEVDNWYNNIGDTKELCETIGLHSDGIDISVTAAHTSKNMHSFMISLLGIGTDEDDNLPNLSIIPGMDELKVYEKDENGEYVEVTNIADALGGRLNVKPEVIFPFGPITWLPGEIVKNTGSEGVDKEEYPYAMYLDYDIPYNWSSYNSPEDMVNGIPSDADKTTIRFNIYLKDDKQYSNGIVKATVVIANEIEEVEKWEVTLHGILLDSKPAYQKVFEGVGKKFNVRMLSLLGPLSLITNIPYAWDDYSIYALEEVPSSIADITICDGIGHYEPTRYTGFSQLLGSILNEFYNN